MITDDAGDVLDAKVAKTEIACTARENCHDITPCAAARLERKTKKYVMTTANGTDRPGRHLQSTAIAHYIVEKYFATEKRSHPLRETTDAHRTPGLPEGSLFLSKNRK